MNSEQEYYISLVDRLRQLPDETEWVEYKVNNSEPELIGEYISALSNSATICNKEKAYLLWGINDKTHEIEGTTFAPKKAKKGNEEIENWLAGGLKPRVDFKFIEVSTDKGNVVVMEIPAAVNTPTSFRGTEFIREMDNGNFEITNMGALLLAKDLNAFAHLKKKSGSCH